MSGPSARSAELLARWRAGDAHAAEELFDDYGARLVALARSRLSAKLARRLDPEDLVQSAFRSFFHGLEQGRYAVAQTGDLWRLLVAITLHKLYRKARHHAAGKRAVGREEVLGPRPDAWPFAMRRLARGPSPEAAAALAEELEHLLAGLGRAQREVAELRLRGHTQDEIATVVGRSQRTVRRWLEEIKDHAQNRCLGARPC